MPIDALSVLCAQLTRDLLAIANFFVNIVFKATFHYGTAKQPNKRILASVGIASNRRIK